MLDLYICGSCIAAGYGIPQKAGFLPEVAWPNEVSNLLEVDNFYNYSFAGRPVDGAVRETMQFVQEYEHEKKSLDKLFVVLELTKPEYREFSPIKDKFGNTVYPYLYLGERQLEIGLSIKDYKKFHNVFFVKDQPFLFDKDKFRKKAYSFSHEIVGVKDIPDYELDNLRNVVNIYYDNKEERLVKYTYDCYTKLVKLIKFLKEKKVRYMMFWGIEGNQDEIVKNYFPLYANECHDDRFMLAHELTITGFVKKFNVTNYYYHPDELGHKMFSSMLVDYIKEKNLLAKMP